MPNPPRPTTHDTSFVSSLISLDSHRSCIAIIFVALVLALPSAATAKSGDQRLSAGGLIYDAALERPMSLVETVVGVGIAGVAYPLSLGSGQSKQVLERCIKEPARNTFTRALGDFGNRSASKCSPVGFGWSLVRASFQVVERPLSFIFGRSPMSRLPDETGDEIEI